MFGYCGLSKKKNDRVEFDDCIIFAAGGSRIKTVQMYFIWQPPKEAQKYFLKRQIRERIP